MNREHKLRIVDEKPVGSGCIAQVYHGKLKQRESKTDVAIKVVHPHIRDQIVQDMGLAIFLADCLDMIPPLKVLDMPRGARQFSDFLLSQTDLSHEAENLRKFRMNFPDDYNRVTFPEVFDDWVTPNVLVMGFESGVTLTQVTRHQVTNVDTGAQEVRESVLPEQDRKSRCTNAQLANIGIKMFCKMLFEDNLIHGDLHPGNILLKKNLANKIFGYLARCEFWAKIGLRFWILVG